MRVSICVREGAPSLRSACGCLRERHFSQSAGLERTREIERTDRERKQFNKTKVTDNRVCVTHYFTSSSLTSQQVMGPGRLTAPSREAQEATKSKGMRVIITGSREKVLLSVRDKTRLLSAVREMSRSGEENCREFKELE